MSKLIPILLSRADAYCQEKKISRSRLGGIVAKDGKFFKRIEDGGDMTVGMYERFIAFFDDHDRKKIEDNERTLEEAVAGQAVS